MARFSDGAEHDSRRKAVLEVLPPSDGLETAAHQRTLEALVDRLDVMPLLTTTPVAVLGDALGCGDVSREITLLCEEGVVAANLPDIARTSILFQARDATAALAVMGLIDGVVLEDAVPVALTRREGVGPIPLSKAPYGAGRHECPGRAHAIALARGMVTALAGHEIIDQGPDLGRPNMRLPSHLIMQRRVA